MRTNTAWVSTSSRRFVVLLRRSCFPPPTNQRRPIGRSDRRGRPLVTFVRWRRVFFAKNSWFPWRTVNWRLLRAGPHSWRRHLNEICMPASSAWGRRSPSTRGWDFLRTAAAKNIPKKTLIGPSKWTEPTEQREPRGDLDPVDPSFSLAKGLASRKSRAAATSANQQQAENPGN